MARSNKTKQKSRVTDGTNRSVAKALRERPDAEIECRSYTHHAFKTDGLFFWHDEDGSGIGRISHCERKCGVSRYDYYDRNNVRVYRTYDYPEGYQLNVGRVYVADAMAEVIRRAEFIAPDIDSVTIPRRRLRAV